MKWLTWRHYRAEIMISFALLAGLAALFIPVIISRLGLFDLLGLASLAPSAPNFSELALQFWGAYPWMTPLVTLLTFVPALVGAWFAIPVIREFEQRTYRLAWTQSATRGHWLLVKLGVGLSAAVAFSAVLSLLTSWYLYPDNLINGPFSNFASEGLVPVAYTVFTLAVAIAIGTLNHRTAPAVLISIVVAIVGVTIIGNGLRPHYITPVQQSVPVFYSAQGIPQIEPRTQSDIVPNTAWVVDQYFVDSSGQRLKNVSLQNGHINVDRTNGSMVDTSDIADLIVNYQPANRYWPFQGIESALFLGLSGLAFGVTIWTVRQRFR
jgi:hypothetical protein